MNDDVQETFENYDHAKAAGRFADALLNAVIDEIRVMKDVWQKLPSNDQQLVVDRVAQAIDEQSIIGLEKMFAFGLPACIAHVDDVTFKKTISAKLTLTNEESAIVLARLRQKSVVIVLAGLDDYKLRADRQSVAVDADQKPLELSDLFTDTADDPRRMRLTATMSRTRTVTSIRWTRTAMDRIRTDERAAIPQPAVCDQSRVQLCRSRGSG